MDERSIVTETVRGLSLESDKRSFSIVSIGPDSCLIVAPDGVAPRGFADIVDGDRLIATCLIVLAAPEGPYLRCTFKRRTIPQSAPAPDYFTG